MNWFIIAAVIWAAVAALLYSKYAKIFDELKTENPDTSAVFFDILVIGRFLLWPLLIPQIITKTIRKVKEKKKNRRR